MGNKLPIVFFLFFTNNILTATKFGAELTITGSAYETTARYLRQ